VCGEHVAQVERVLGVPVKIGPDRQPRCCHCVDHRPIAQDGKVKGVAIERHELLCQLRDAVDERRDQFLFGSLPDMRRTDCVYCPMVTLFMSNECTDADNRVVDVLWELVAERLSDFFVRFSSELIGSSTTCNIRYGFEVPNDDVVGHATRPEAVAAAFTESDAIFFAELCSFGERPLNRRSTRLDCYQHPGQFLRR
jgi:hypothetical protein